jgi:hypothetical protein
MTKVLNLEIHVLRAERSDNAVASVILDFAEAAKGDILLPLMTTLQISASFAAIDGLSEEEWKQHLRSRHAGDEGHLNALLRALETLVADHALPWSES